MIPIKGLFAVAGIALLALSVVACSEPEVVEEIGIPVENVVPADATTTPVAGAAYAGPTPTVSEFLAAHPPLDLLDLDGQPVPPGEYLVWASVTVTIIARGGHGTDYLRPIAATLISDPLRLRPPLPPQ